MSDLPINLGDNRIAVIYHSRDELERAKTIVLKKLGIAEHKIEVIEPLDHGTSEKLEGKSKPIRESIFKLHITFGVLGLIIGMGLAFLLVEFGPAFTATNSMFTYIALISPSLFIGLFIAGLFSLKPQHDQVNMSVVEHKNAKDWILLVDTTGANVTKEDVYQEVEYTPTIAIHK